MKYGLIIYNLTDNLGDDILTYAAYQFLPSVDYIIDRENVDTFIPNEKEYVAVIFNGWFLYNKFNWPPSEYIYPLFIGIHFSPNQRWGIGDEYLDGLGKEYLKKYQPIGCRDEDTLRKMQERNIEAFFSGCLTLTLQPFSGINKINKVLLVDLDKDICEFVSEKVGSDNVEIISHDIKEKGKSWNERKNIVENRLKKYQSASLVITTRLHCALPCLALGTKVLMISRDTEDYDNRISSYDKYLNTCTVEELLSGQVDMHNIPDNSDDYKLLAQNIREKCESFIYNCQNQKLCELPDIDVFRKCLAGKMEWQRMLIKKEERVDLSEIYAAKEWLAEQYNSLKRELESYQKTNGEQQSYIQELISGKEYLEKHSEEQEEYIQELMKGKEYLEKRSVEQEKYIHELIVGKEYLEKHTEEQEKYIQELITGKEYLEKHTEEQEKYIQELITGR